MNLLILGGTRFLGRALVDVALKLEHKVTLFNRGQSNPNLYPELNQLRGDRDGGLDVLSEGSWDAAIDTCGYIPRVVRGSAELLSEAIDHYTFISSLNVYEDASVVGLDENAPLARMSDESVEEINGETYGPLKALCEEAISEAMAGRALLVRSGLIVGPHDPSDRFTYWPYRVARGGEVLAPGDPEAPVQFVDARDSAEWILHAIEERLTGPYNVTGPDYRLSMRQLLKTCNQIFQSDASFTWVSDAFLVENEVAAYTEMPLWVPAEFAGFSAIDCDKAISAGLTFRPLEETMRDTFDWQSTRPAGYQWQAGLTPEREAKLLQRWKETKTDSDHS